MGWWVGSRHLLTRIPPGEGGVSTPKWGTGGGGGRVIHIAFLYVPPWV